jgi:hypothetical protein
MARTGVKLLHVMIPDWTYWVKYMSFHVRDIQGSGNVTMPNGIPHARLWNVISNKARTFEWIKSMDLQTPLAQIKSSPGLNIALDRRFLNFPCKCVGY